MGINPRRGIPGAREGRGAGSQERLPAARGRWGLEADQEPVRSVDLPGSAVMDTPPSPSAIMQRGAATQR
jgi:hypothetical protein